jgi:ribonuclease BN (tRNA processing enzyme)
LSHSTVLSRSETVREYAVGGVSGEVGVEFLGSGDAFGSGGRFQPCLHIYGGDEPLLIDCGASSLTAIKRARLEPRRFGYVILSHLHGDHYGGLPFLILDGQFSGRTRPLVVAGPSGVGQRVENAMEVLFPGSARARRSFPLRFCELDEWSPTEIGPAQVTPFLVEHPAGGPSFALRIEYGGRVIAYSGDTEWTDALPAVARGADLFVCEAYSFCKQIPHHLDYKTLRAKRAELECARVVLTHMSAEMLARLDEVELDVASDGDVVAL